MALEVGPGTASIPAGALLVGTDDGATMQTFLDRLAGLIADGLTAQATVQATGPQIQSESYKGTTIRYLPIPSLSGQGVAPAYAVVDGMGVIASSPDEIERIVDTHQGAPSILAAGNFRAARPDLSSSGMLFLDVQGVAGAVRDALSGADRQSYDTQVEPCIHPLRSLVLDGRNSTDHQSLRVFVSVQ